MNKELKRCFIALDLPRREINEIKKIQDLLKKRNLFIGKFTEPENVHLTLKFLGEIDDKKIERVKKRLKEIRFDKFEASLGRIGIFSKKIMRIIWIELTGKGVFELQKEIDEKLSDLFESEFRFMSHLTIARIKHVPNKKRFISYLKNMRAKKIKFKINKFYLKKSELSSKEPVYEDIKGYNLRKNII